jgi:hypothetical protein
MCLIASMAEAGNSIRPQAILEDTMFNAGQLQLHLY